jgi:hypothetical protein
LELLYRIKNLIFVFLAYLWRIIFGLVPVIEDISVAGLLGAVGGQEGEEEEEQDCPAPS